MITATFFIGGWNEINNKVTILNKDNSFRYSSATQVPIDMKLGNAMAKTHAQQMDLLRLDSHDMDWISQSDVTIKRNEIICRYRTHNTMVGKMSPLIKINVDKMLCYFLEEGCTDTPIFQPRGVKLDWLNIFEGDTFLEE